MKEHWDSLKKSLPIIIFFVFSVLFYGPLSLYLPNAEELWFRIGEVLKIVSVISLIAALCMSLFFFVLPEKVSSFFRKLLFGGALGFYVQGNLIPVSYGSGVLDGSAIDWGAYKTYALINTGIWVICILLPFVLAWIMRNKKGLITRVLIIASLFLTAIQIPAMISQFLSYHPNVNANVSIKKEGMFDYSDRENVIMFMLDTYDEAYFDQFIEEEPSFTDSLTGFVHYENTLSAGAKTIVAVPAMFTGKPFKRENTYSEYLEDVWGQDNVLSVMHDHGYDVRVYSETMLYSDDVINYVSNFTTEGAKVGSYFTLAKKLYKLDLFKFLPHVLKKRFTFDTAEFQKAKSDTEYILNDKSDASTIASFRKKGLSVSDDQEKVFILYHMFGAHSKYKLSREGKLVSSSNVHDQCAGCMAFVKEVLEEMKAKGVYDDATIIITADHGDKNKGEHPIFLLKLPGSTEAYRTSKAPVSLFDVAVFLTNIVGYTLPDQEFGTDLLALDEDEVRERHFFYNTSGNSRVVINEFATTSDASDEENLEKINTFEDVNGPDTPYVLGTELYFTTEATANRYCIEGWGTNTGFRTKLRGPYTRMDIPIQDLPETGNLSVHYGLYYRGKKEKDYIVYANGEEVGRGTITHADEKEGINFDVPVASFKDSNILTIEFEFPWVSKDEMEMPAKSRTQTISFTDMIINWNQE